LQDGSLWAVSPGTLTLTPPHHTHELTVEEPLSFYYLQFLGEKEVHSLLVRLVERQKIEGPLKVEPGLVVEVGRLKDKLDSPLADRVASGVHGFLAWLYDLAAGRSEEEPDGIDRALVWLRKNLDRRLGLNDLAFQAGMDRFVFCRRFKTRTGLSPLAYVHRSKVEAAGFLLAVTDLPLAEVAHRFGFSDEFHFGKVFRKWRGLSPGRWRKIHPTPDESSLHTV